MDAEKSELSIEAQLGDPSDIVKSVADLSKPGTVLDLGVGYGRNALFLARRGFSVVGVDISEAEIGQFEDYARKLGVEVRGTVGDIAQFRFDKKHDVVLSVAVLNLMKREEADELVRSIKANTEEGGLNAINVFTELVPREGVQFLYESNELRDLYKDWEIVTYREHQSSMHKHENWPPHRHTNADLLARKPRSSS